METNPELFREIELALDSRFQREKNFRNRNQHSAASPAQAILAATKSGTRQEPSAVNRRRFTAAAESNSDSAQRAAKATRRRAESQEAQDTTPVGQKIEFQDVAKFENRELVFILGSLDPQVALLALTGAEQRLIDRILKQLPTRDARAFREKMRQMGPLRLSDVLEAQQEFAREASRLIAKGMIRNPFAQRMAAIA